MHHSLIEPLESRIAPASATATFLDRDGDDVLITVTTLSGSSAALKTALEAAQGFALEGVGLQLQELDLSAAAFAGANVTILAKRNATSGGDGLVAVGRIEALGQELGTVVVDGDLGRIVAGDGVGSTAVKSLTVRSFGRYGLETQGGVGNLNTLLVGNVGTITVKEDVTEAIVQNLDGNVVSFVVGGSIIGGSGINSGSVGFTGNVGLAKIGGSLVSGTGNGSGKVSIGGNLTSLSIGGSLFGPDDNVADASGQLDVGGNIVKLRIKGDVVSGSGGYNVSSQIDLGGNVGTLQIGGSLQGTSRLGASGIAGGAIEVDGSVVSLLIGGDILGGTAGAGRAGSLTVGSVQTLSIGGDVRGGTGTSTGTIDIDSGTVLSLKIGGSLIGGPSAGTGAIIGDFQNTKLQTVIIGGNLESRGDSFNQGYIRVNSIGSLLIKGDVISSTEAGSDTEQIHAAIGLGKVVIGGGIRGNATNPVQIFSDALGSLRLGKNVEYAEIAVTNTDALVKSVTVNGAWLSSRLVLSEDDGADEIFGTNDDPAISADATGSIARIVIKGQVAGTFGGNESFRIRAPKIGAFTAAGTIYGFGVGAQAFNLGITGDVTASDAA